MREMGLTGARASSVVAAMVAVMFMGSTLVTPLYAQYRESFGFSEITLTLIYAVYAIGNLLALLLFGRLSDQAGRRPVSVAAFMLAGLAMLIFLFAGSEAWLFAARTMSGFAIGVASGTAAAWLAELDTGKDKARATLIASVANFTGLAIGPLLAGVLVQYAPWPLRLSYIVYLLILAGIAILIQRTQETVRKPTRSVRGVSLRPRLGVPPGVRFPFIAPATTAFATFALIGFYAALIPSILAETLHETNKAVGGAVVFELFCVSALVAIVTRRVGSRVAMLSGLALLLPSVVLLVTAQAFDSLTLLLAGTAVSGVAAALGYRGSLQVINQIVPNDRRAEVVSSYYLTMFLGNSLPVIGVGIVTAVANRAVASVAFAVMIAALAVAACVAGWKYTPRL
jgi:MFS family permease